MRVALGNSREALVSQENYVRVMKTILVPIDFSSISGSSVETASMLAKATNSSVTFIHVIQENLFFDGMGIPVPGTSDETDSMVFEARQALNSYVSAAVSSGLSASAFVTRGHPAEHILQKAAEFKPSLIVMGSHAHGSLHHLLAGSTAEGVIKRATCPVVLVPPGFAEMALANARMSQAPVGESR
jgi:nucleotide-binding universal stress UspA family protein